MAFDYKENLTISKILMSPKHPSNMYSFNDKQVSYEALNATLQENLRELTYSSGKFDYYKYQNNQKIIYQLLGETLNDVMPKNVIDNYGMFAEVRTINQGDSIIFHHKIGRQRAKQFITRVALAGRYEVFELADEKFSIKTTAYGGAARIGIEEFLDGRVQWADYLDIINEGMNEAVYKEISKALIAAIEKFPATNKVAASQFDEAQFDRLIQTVSAYGSPVIYCTVEAAMTLLPNNEWVSDSMKDEKWRTGYFARYKGTPIMVLPQSFTDETNTTKVMDPSYIYIFPTDGSKPVKIVFEGQTLVKEFENRDWSTELQTYQKFGVAVTNTNNLAVFRNFSLHIENVPGRWPTPASF